MYGYIEFLIVTGRFDNFAQFLQTGTLEVLPKVKPSIDPIVYSYMDQIGETYDHGKNIPAALKLFHQMVKFDEKFDLEL